MSNLSYQYIAGFFDGEGHVTIGKTQKNPKWQPTYYLTIGFTNTNTKILEEIRNFLGIGRIVLNSRGYKRDNPRTCYSLVASAIQAKEILTLIFPYLVVKKDRALLAISFQERVKLNKFQKLSNDEVLVRESIRTKIMELNKK